MADLSITVAVTTGTQYVTGSTGSIYTFDGSQPASFTFPWVASGTLRLDQSGSSNDGHPLIFSTSNSSVLATMKAGIISSGVTYYLDGSSNQSDYTNTTTFNAATTRYIEIAPASQTDFYFACWIHGIGMGGIMDITQNTWGALSWGDHDWGDQDTITVSPSGLSITASLGDVLSFPEQGWGSDTWGAENWGESGLTVTLTGFSITASLGELPYAASEEGWGRDEWGTGNWGQNTTTVKPEGLEMTTGLGPSGWGIAPWEEQVSWGGDLSLLTEQITIAALTGLEITGSVGTPTLTFDMIDFAFTGPAAMGAGLGVPNINNGADHTQGVGSLLATGSVGSLGHEMTYPLTGIEATGVLGTLTITSAKLVIISDSLLITGSVGSVTVADMAVGFSGLQATGSVGTPVVTDMQVGISGLEMTGALGSGGVSPLHYKDVDITGNTSYTYVKHAGEI